MPRSPKKRGLGTFNPRTFPDSGEVEEVLRFPSQIFLTVPKSKPLNPYTGDCRNPSFIQMTITTTSTSSSSSSSPFSFLSYSRRKPPLTGAFVAPSDLSGPCLVDAISALVADVISTTAAVSSPQFQRANTKSLVRKLKVLSVMFESLKESSIFLYWPGARFPPSTMLCFREFYILIYRAKILLEYCSQSSRLWLLLRNPQISGSFHDLAQEFATLLDVLPLGDLRLDAGVREQMDLLRRQCRRSKLYIDPKDEELRRHIFSFLASFENGSAPDTVELQNVFVDGLSIRDARSCYTEIDFLEEQILNQDEDADSSVLGGVIALTRYSKFMLFGFHEVGFDRGIVFTGDESKKMRKKLLSQGSDSSFTVPKDFCCPISLDLMTDPVIVGTGQTYDRASITHWIEEGHNTCPNSGQMLKNKKLVPNIALRNLISRWCAAFGIPYDSPDGADSSVETIAAACASKAAVEANMATARILVQQLRLVTDVAKATAARELRLLAKTGKSSRAFIAELGAIPLLCHLFCSSDSVAQENAVTAILNLSIQDCNKKRIMEEEGCLRLIVDVLMHGQTMEARENAAATLFSLSAVHDYKTTIVNEPGAIEALSTLLMQGSLRGKKDAVMALFNLSTHPESWMHMLKLGAVSALVGALRNEIILEEAAGALALLVKHQTVAVVVGNEDTVIANLIGLMRRGTPKGKENAVAALQEMCRRGGLELMSKVSRMPSLGGLIQSILFTGTKRARRKAAQLARICQRCELTTASTFGNAWAMDTLTRTGSMISSGFQSGDVSVAMPMVPVL